MLFFNFIKFFGIFAFALAFSTACRFWQKPVGETPSPAPYTAEELVSEIPFSTKEPEIFQLEIVIAAGGAENKIFVARNGNNRRIDYNADAKNRVSLVRADKNYLIMPGKKIFVDSAGAKDVSVSESWTDFLTTERLNSNADAKFFKLEPENNLTRYRVVFGETEKSETIIFIDENAGFPVRQEFYSREGEQKILTMTVELRNLKLEAADDLFLVPSDYKKVSREEFTAILRKKNE